MTYKNFSKILLIIAIAFNPLLAGFMHTIPLRLGGTTINAQPHDHSLTNDVGGHEDLQPGMDVSKSITISKLSGPLSRHELKYHLCCAVGNGSCVGILQDTFEQPTRILELALVTSHSGNLTSREVKPEPHPPKFYS